MIYLKETNGKLIPAPIEYQDETGFYPSFNQNVEAMLSKGFKPFDEELASKYFASMAVLQNGELVDITNTDEYKAKIAVQENAAKKLQLQAQIDEFDKKRIRAGFEPSIKDETKGQTWLEYYTLQIQDLRAQITEL